MMRLSKVVLLAVWALSLPVILAGCFGGSSSSDEGPERALAAVAGGDREAEVGETIALDGTDSIDASRDEIVEWRWFVFSPDTWVDIEDENAPETTLTINPAAEGQTIEIFLQVKNAEDVGAQDDFRIEVSGPTPGDADLSDAERPLLFFSENAGQEGDLIVKSLHAADPADPRSDRTAQVDSVATDNARSRVDGENDATRRGGNEFGPDRITLPLGVLEMTLEADGELTVEERHAVVFNTPEGQLQRVNGFDGLEDSVRVSNESDAEVVCAAKVFTDYSDVTRSVIAYQIPSLGDRDCTSNTQWFAVRLYDQADDEPVKLTEPDTVRRYDDGFETGLSPEWTFPLRDEQGAIDELIVYQGNNNFPCNENGNGLGKLWRVSLEDGSRDLLEPTEAFATSTDFSDESICTFRKLAALDDRQFLFQTTFQAAGSPRHVFLFDADDNSFALVEPDIGVPGGLLDVAARPTGPDQTLPVNDRVYVLDIEDSDADSGRLIEIDVDPPSVSVPTYRIVDDDWGTGHVPKSFVTDGERLGWTYAATSQADDTTDTWALRIFDTDTDEGSLRFSNQDFIRPGGLDRTIFSPAAPADRIFFNRNSPGAGVGESLSDLTQSEELSGSILLSQSWKTDVEAMGEQAEYLFYLTSNDLLAVVDATDFSNTIELTQTQIVTRNQGSASAEGYGVELLMGLQQGTSTQVYYVNPETGEFEGLSTLGLLTAPISFHY